METATDTNVSQATSADKACVAAAISLLSGVGLFVLSLVLDRLVKAHYRGVGDAFAIGTCAAIAILGLVVPLLGVSAVIAVASDWKSITSACNGSKNEGQIANIARRFLVSSLIFGVVSLVVLGLVTVSGMKANLPGIVGIWLVVISLLALAMGLVSYGLSARASTQVLPRMGALSAVVVSLGAVVVVLLSTSFGGYLLECIKGSGAPQTFSGSSKSLKDTIILPTLDSPYPENKNVVWCSSFQLAWNQMKDDVIGAAVEVVGAEELAARLNNAEQSDADVEASSFYSAAGRVEEGIIGKVQKDMAVRFPSHSVPDFSYIAAIPRAILAYSYLTANVPFKYPYRQVRERFVFTDSRGLETDVGAFGVWGIHWAYKKMREQVEILYFREDREATNRDLRMKEFAIDLCRHSAPCQVVAAVVEPKETLAQTLTYIDRRIENFRQQRTYEQERFLDRVDVLTVPEMFWEIDHRFEELIGKEVANANPAMPIVEARQWIKFKLDRYGAALESEAIIAVAAIPRHFKFNRPFLVYMKKRDREQPFFVMWVDNAELLNRK
ncbi:MAG: hypothetical protein ACYS74_17515 [Planctomycetota bacterium]|jgi:hypothetical protein